MALVVRERTPRSLVHKLETSKYPLEELQAIHGLREYLDRCEKDSLLKARRLGCSVSNIAEALGVTRQSVYNKLRALPQPRHGVDLDDTVVLPDLESERRHRPPE